MLLTAFLLSFTWMATLGLAGPSANEHWKLPPLALVLSDPDTRLPPLPQSGYPLTTLNVSPESESLTAKLKVFVVPSFALVGGLLKETAGAELAGGVGATTRMVSVVPVLSSGFPPCAFESVSATLPFDALSTIVWSPSGALALAETEAATVCGAGAPDHVIGALLLHPGTAVAVNVFAALNVL